MLLDDIGHLPPPGYPSGESLADKAKRMLGSGLPTQIGKPKPIPPRRPQPSGRIARQAVGAPSGIPVSQQKDLRTLADFALVPAPQKSQLEIQGEYDMSHPESTLTGALELGTAYASTLPIVGKYVGEAGRVGLTAIERAGDIFNAPSSFYPEEHESRLEAVQPKSGVGKFVSNVVGGAGKAVAELGLMALTPLGKLGTGAVFGGSAIMSEVAPVATERESGVMGATKAALGMVGGAAYDPLMAMAPTALSRLTMAATIGEGQTIAESLATEGRLPTATEQAEGIVGLAAFQGLHELKGLASRLENREQNTGEHNATIEGNESKNGQQEHQGIPLGDNVPEDRTEVRESPSGQTGGGRRAEREAEIATPVESESVEAVAPVREEVQPEVTEAQDVPSEPIGRTDSGDPEAQREGVYAGMGNLETGDGGGQDRTGDTEIEGARAVDLSGNRGDESLRQTEAAGTPGPGQVGEERVVEPPAKPNIPENFRPKYQEHFVGDKIEGIPFGHEPTKGIVADFDPETREYTLENGQTFHESEVFSTVESQLRPEVKASDKDIVDAMSPTNVREATLQYLAQGGKLSYEDAERDVFGSHLKPSEKRRNYLQRNDPSDPVGSRGRSIDDFISSTLGDRLPGHADEHGQLFDQLAARNEVHDIIQSVRSSKHARELLADEYKKHTDVSGEPPLFSNHEGGEAFDDSFPFGANVKESEPADKEPVPEGVTGLRKSIVARERSESGLEPAKKPERMTGEEFDKEARRQMSANRTLGKDTLERVQKTGRYDSPLDVHIVKLEKAERKASWKHHTEEVIRTANDPNVSDTERLNAEARLQVARKEWEESLSLRPASTEAGRTLQALAEVVSDDDRFEYVNLKPDWEASVNHGKPLDEQTDAWLKGESNRGANLRVKSEVAEDAEREAYHEAQFHQHLRSFIREMEGESKKVKEATRTGKLRDYVKKVIVEEDRYLVNKYGRANAGFDPADFAHFVKWAGAQIIDKALALADFVSLVAQKFPRLDLNVKELYESGKAWGEKNYQRAAGADIADVLANSAGKLTGRKVYNLLRARFNQGVAKEDLLKTVTADLQKHHPGITEREVRDTFSDYGKVKYPSQEVDRKALRELRRLSQLQSKLEDLQQGKAAKRAGSQRDKPLAEERRLQREINQLLKKQGIQTVDPAKQLATRLDAAKSKLRNELEDLGVEIAALERGDRPSVHEPGSLKYDQESRELQKQVVEKRKQRDAIRDALDESEGKPKLSDVRRMKATVASVKRAIESTRAKIRDHDIKTPPKAGVTSPELEILREHLGTLRATLKQLRDAADPTKTPEAQRERKLESIREGLQKQFDALEGKQFRGEESANGAAKTKEPVTDAGIEESRALLKLLRSEINEINNPSLSPEAQRQKQSLLAAQRGIKTYNELIEQGSPFRDKATVEETPELKRARETRDGLRDLYMTQRNLNHPERLEKMRNDAYVRQTQRRIKKVKSRLEAGDYTKDIPVKREYSKAAQDMRLEYERWKQMMDDAREKERLKNRTRGQKIWDALPELNRANVLSYPNTIIKIAVSALGGRGVVFAPQEVVRALAARALPRLAAKADIEGSPNPHFRSNYEGMFGQGLKDALAKLTFKTTDIELEDPQQKQQHVKRLINIGAQSHAAGKAAPRRGMREWALENLKESARAEGRDPENPDVLKELKARAANYSNRAQFMQRNAVTQVWNTWKKMAEVRNTPISRGVVRGMDVVAPVTNVPVNVFSDAIVHLGGWGSGSVKAIRAYRKGLENLSPDEANLIMRHFSKGWVGPGLLLLGFFSPNQFGGFYVKGEKRSDDLRENDIRGVTPLLAHAFSHFSPMMITQLGATIRRTMEADAEKGKSLATQVTDGLMAGGIGIVGNVPFVGVMRSLAGALSTPSEASYYITQLSKTLLEPGILQWGASLTDPAPAHSRNPQTFGEQLEMGIPVLRETVPMKKAKQSHSHRHHRK